MFEVEDNMIEYLERCGLTVHERENDLIDIVPPTSLRTGETVTLTVKKEDVPAIIRDTYQANISMEDVFDTYVIERTLT